MKPSKQPDMTEAQILEEAEQTVLRVRGSWDAPGFDACVRGEVQNIRERLKGGKNND